MKVTIFESLTKIDNPQYANILTVANLIKTGGKQKEYLEDLRTKDKAAYKEGKKKLPLILFGGEFEKRNKGGLVTQSGLMVLDFDNLDGVALKDLKEEVEGKPYTALSFISPSADGFKAVIRIPKVKSDEEYKLYFTSLQKDFPQLDKSGADISRACFFSYDPNIYINKYATEYIIPDKSKRLHQVKDWNKVNQALRKIEDAIEGEKHHIRTKISYLFGGWVASKALNYADALDLLSESVRKNTTDYSAAMQTVRDCLMAGMNQPLSLSEEKITLEMKVGLGKSYYHMDEVWDKVKSFYEKGYSRGFDTGWECLDNIYSVLMGTTTIVYAFPFSGKSQLRHEIYINLSTNHGLNHVLLTPETGDVEQVFAELISIHVGKTISGENKMTEKEFNDSAEFIKRHFFVIDPLGKDFNMRDFFTQVEAIERCYNIIIHTATIDPLNTLNHVFPNMRSDKAQDKDLQIFNADARKNGRHNCIVTHCRDVESRKERDRDTKEVIKEWLPLPKPRDILNGQSFWRNGNNLMGNWRPIDFDDNPLDGYAANETIIDIAKVKPKFQSKVGRCSLYYDAERNRYYELKGMQKVYAKGFILKSPQPQREPEPVKSRISTQGWGTPEEGAAPF